jgi:AcrR family transcriptional regulator
MGTAPRGKEAVKAALIDSAAELFSTRGPSAVGVREIAQRAGVNHGLVHRHFGSKEALLRAVMTKLSQEVSASLGPPRPDERLSELLIPVFEQAQGTHQHWRILAMALLEGRKPEDIQAGFPVFERILAASQRAEPEGMTAESFTSILIAMGLGMLVFAPWLQSASGQDEQAWQQTRLAMLLFGRRAYGKTPVQDSASGSG